MLQLKLKPLPPKPSFPAVPRTLGDAAEQPRQHRLMKGALLILLAALGMLVYRDRDFWFPDSEDMDDTVMQGVPAETPQSAKPDVRVVAQAEHPQSSLVATRKARHPKGRVAEIPATQVEEGSGAVVTERTVLPPLEVEVVAGDAHRTVRPGDNALRVDMQQGVPPRTPAEASAPEREPATGAAASTDAAERVEMSRASSALVTSSVEPDYPLLARQMKVQGSVVLQALISRDGAIQNLRVLSGPPILSGAAREAVKQWHFKPHYEGAEAVETQAKITVHFTISTN